MVKKSSWEKRLAALEQCMCSPDILPFLQFPNDLAKSLSCEASLNENTGKLAAEIYLENERCSGKQCLALIAADWNRPHAALTNLEYARYQPFQGAPSFAFEAMRRFVFWAWWAEIAYVSTLVAEGNGIVHLRRNGFHFIPSTQLENLSSGDKTFALKIITANATSPEDMSLLDTKPHNAIVVFSDLAHRHAIMAGLQLPATTTSIRRPGQRALPALDHVG